MRKYPNIVLIVSDEHFGGAMTHKGDLNVITSNLDALAAAGVSFDRGYSNCPVCTPSRGTIFSGRYAHCGPVQGFFDVYKSTAPSFATILRDVGYHTAYFGKWHCGVVQNQQPPAVRDHRNDYPNHPWVLRTPERHRAGFEDWFGFELNNAPFNGFYFHQDEVNPRRFEGYQTDELTDLAMSYLKEYDREESLFMVLSVEPPHFPLEVPERNRKIDPNNLTLPPTYVETENGREKLATYYAMIENLDENIGRLCGELDQSDRFRENTLIIYISDHGDFMGTRGCIERKEHPHEQGVKIPYIFRWPQAIPAFGNREELISLVDLLPTTLGLIGIEIPTYIQGCDMSDLLRGKACKEQESVLVEMHGAPRWGLDWVDWRGIVTQRWKYVFYETGHDLLFDLRDDPYEMVNLSKTRLGVVEVMKERLLQKLIRTREPFFEILIEHGVKQPQSLDVSGGPTPGIGPYWSDGSIRWESNT